MTKKRMFFSEKIKLKEEYLKWCEEQNKEIHGGKIDEKNFVNVITFLQSIGWGEIKELESENEELKREIMKEQTIRVWAEKDAGKLYDENARLKEKMQKMIELKEPDIELNPYTGDWELRYQEVVTKVKVYDERSEAEARFAELKAKNNLL